MVWTQKKFYHEITCILLSYQPDNNVKQQKNLPIPAAIIFTLSHQRITVLSKSSYYEQKPHAPSAAQFQELMETEQLLCIVTRRSFHTSSTKTTPSFYKSKTEKQFSTCVYFSLSNKRFYAFTMVPTPYRRNCSMIGW